MPIFWAARCLPRCPGHPLPPRPPWAAVSLPELKARGYDANIAIGTLAGAGTFGFLIPPSIILIVYGAATEQSIARLFLAGVLPGADAGGAVRGLCHDLGADEPRPPARARPRPKLGRTLGRNPRF